MLILIYLGQHVTFLCLSMRSKIANQLYLYYQMFTVLFQQRRTWLKALWRTLQDLHRIKTSCQNWTLNHFVSYGCFITFYGCVISFYGCVITFNGCVITFYGWVITFESTFHRTNCLQTYRILL